MIKYLLVKDKKRGEKMNFLKKIIQRKVTICIVVFILVCLGIFSVTSMPVKLLPDLNIPILGVSIVYPGAAPEVVNQDVTSQLEDSLTNITNVTDVTSYSLDNVSVVILSFEYETNLDDKKAEINEIIDKLNLPSVCYNPEIVEVDFNSSALASIVITNDDDNLDNIKKVASNLKKEFLGIDGVGSVEVKGLPTSSVSIKPIMGLEMISLLLVEKLSYQAYDIPLGSINTNNGIISIRNESAPHDLLDLASTSITIPLPRSTWLMLHSYQTILKNLETEYGTLLSSFTNNNLSSLFDKYNALSIDELDSFIRLILEYKDKIDSIPNEQYDSEAIVKKYLLPLMSYGITINQNLVDQFRNMDKTKLSNLLDQVKLIKQTNLKLSVELISFISSLDTDKIVYDEAVVDNVTPLENDNTNIGRYTVSLCNVKEEDGVTIITPNVAYLDVETTYDTYSYYNNHIGVTIEVYGKSGCNTSEIVKNVKQVISNSNSDLSTSIVLLDDQAEFIDDSLSNVLTSIIIGGVLAIIVIYLFLRKVRSSLVIAITMPLSVLTTLIILYLMGITLNMVSLGGLAVGIGMLVDNSIVVIESITKRRENDKMMVKDACFNGTKDVIGSLFASTLTTVCVFIPILFTKGLTKEIFTDLAWAVVLSLSISFIIAVIVIPTLYGLICNTKKEEEIKQDKFTQKLEGKYQNFLEKILHKKNIIVVSMLIVFLASIGLVLTRGMEFLPPSDKGLIEINLGYESKTTLEEANTDTLRIKERIEENIDNIDSLSISVGKLGLIKSSMNGSIRLQLNSKAKKTKEVVQDIRELLKDEKASVNVKEVDGIVASITSNFNDLSISLMGEDEQTLIEITNKIETKLLSQKGITGVTNNLTSLQTEYKIDVDINKCNEYGIDYPTLIQTLRVGLAGYEVGTIVNDKEEVKISVSFMNKSITSYDDLANFMVTTNDGLVIHLSDIAEIKSSNEKVLILKDNGQLLVQISVDTYNLDTGSASKIIDKVTNEVLKDYPGYSVKASGVQSYLNDAFSGLIVALVISIFLLYGVMACQFESFTKPLIIMASIPLTFTGAFLALTITNVSLNIVSFIGIIMLMGVIVNNAIIMLDEIKRLKEEEQLSEYDAVIKGCSNRVRPILMTTLTTVLALIPLSLGLGSGGELMQPMGIVVIGGLLFGTAVTLMLIPSIYCGVKKIKKPTQEN